MKDLKGIITALVTPLNEKNTVNGEQLINLINIQIKAGVGGILFLGGTGEYNALTLEARKEVVDIAVREVNGRVPVIVGVLEPGIGESIKFCKYCEEAGADAVLVLTPFYVHATQQGIIDFYKELTSKVNIPIMVYNIPYRTCVNVKPETYEELINLPNIVGLKDCSTLIGEAIELVDKIGDKVSVLSGEDYIAVYAFIMGSPGAIVASSNIIPEVWVEIFNLTQEKRYDEAVKLHMEYFYLMKGIFSEINPSPLKYLMNSCGIPCGKQSIPLIEPSDETKRLLDELALKYNLRK